MYKVETDKVDWVPTDMIEVTLKDQESFLLVKETLTRIGIASRKENILYQSCHILHKKGKYYIVHFKELFALDGKPTNFTQNDVERRNAIVNLLSEWKLVDLVDESRSQPAVSIRQLKILPYKEKENWDLQAKYNIGNGGNSNNT